ncbi:MAG: hypothetical protein LRY73_15815 [Bacillus sp. (in: Bacteria)]|nr:hypothetical protein [Bacillus sp. (in: firmicutes)]
MKKKRMCEMSYGEVQQKLVKLVMKEMEGKTVTPLMHFPIVLERVDTFLLVHWPKIWKHCAHMKWDEWLYSNCYSLFYDEVIKDFEICPYELQEAYMEQSMEA